jgi:YVTN family beta-propeller protein
VKTPVAALLTSVLLLSAGTRTPAGERPASKGTPGQLSILPGGRIISPLGKVYSTGSGPFGIAVSPDGKTVVTADGGPGPFSLTILDKPSNATRTLQVKSRRDNDDKKDEDEDEWRSVFMGLAFSDNTHLWAAEGNSGVIRLFDVATGTSQRRLSLNQKINQKDFRDSYSSDIALDGARGILWVVDQANFRVAAFDVKSGKLLSSTAVGRLPFSIALSPDGKRAYVANIGMFEYKALPGADSKRARETGVPKPVFGFPSKESRKGAPNAPALGDPNAPESNSLCVLDLEDPSNPKVLKFIHTGLPFPKSLGGSSPSGVLATATKVFVSNGHNDTISIIDTEKLTVTQTIEIRVPGFEKFRGALPIGMALAQERLLVALAGLNAVAVIDPSSGNTLGVLPAGWFPTRIATHGNDIHVVNAKGAGTGPNASLEKPFERSFQAERRRGSLQVFSMPSDLAAASAEVWKNTFQTTAETALPKELKHVVIIVKENRTFDEVFGDIDKDLGAPKLARYGSAVAPNHHAMARQWAYGNNFYADSEVSVDGHHWLAGVYPNAWTESTLMASYGGQKDFRFPSSAPGRYLFTGSNSSVHPEEQLEAGAIWHHLERHKISFRNFGEGFELAGIDEGPGLKPTGARFLTNVPAPAPLFRNTFWDYPGYNTNIPDQFRASQFIGDIRRSFLDTNKELPRLIYIHLPNDHGAKPRPKDGYPVNESYMADNDYALGRIVEFLSNTRWWKNMAILVTEDDSQGGVDHIDSHRTVLLAMGPYVKRGYVIHNNSSFPGLIKTAFRLLGIPPLNLFDATATDLSDAFTAEPDFTPFKLLPVDPKIFDPAKAKDPLESSPPPMSERMDDPRVLREQHRKR